MKQRARQSSSGKSVIEKRIDQYIATWLDNKGYQEIPDEVPSQLMEENLAPSYKAICLAILKNDHHCISLGMSPPESKWYSELKRIELEQRKKDKQEMLYDRI